MDRLPKIVVVFTYTGNPNRLTTVSNRVMADFRNAISTFNLGPTEEKPKIDNIAGDVWQIYPKIMADNDLTAGQLLDVSNTVADSLELEVEKIGGIIISVKRLG